MHDCDVDVPSLCAGCLLRLELLVDLLRAGTARRGAADPHLDARMGRLELGARGQSVNAKVDDVLGKKPAVITLSTVSAEGPLAGRPANSASAAALH